MKVKALNFAFNNGSQALYFKKRFLCCYCSTVSPVMTGPGHAGISFQGFY